MPDLDDILARGDRRRRAERALRSARALGQGLALREGPGGRAYLADASGALTAPVAFDRPLDAGEYAALDRARAQGDAAALAQLYAPGSRARAVPYWDGAYLSPQDLAARREEALWRAAARRTVAQDRRAEAARALLAHERAYGEAPSDRQREAAQRWADARALAGDTATHEALLRRDRLAEAARARAEREGARGLAAESERLRGRDALAAALAQAQAQRDAARAAAEGSLSVAREETRRAEANNANALSLAGLNNASAERVAQARADADRYVADQGRLGQLGAAEEETRRAEAQNASAERVAQTRAQAQRDVAAIQGALAAARAQGALAPGQEAAFKRAESLVRLSQTLANGGLDETALYTLDTEIDRDASLSPEEKARRKAQLRQNNPEAVSWLLGAAAREMEAAGLPGMPAPGQTAQGAPAAAGDAMGQNWL